MKKTPLPLRTLSLLTAAFALAQCTYAQSTWTGGGANQNWSTSLNWSGIVPSADAVTFPDGAFPVTTNAPGVVNNVVDTSTTITTLTYNNNGANSDYVTTKIPAGNILTVGGNLTIGNAAVPVFATVTGGGSLVAGTNGSSTLAVQSTSGSATLDLSTLSNFSLNAGGISGTINIGASTGGAGILNLAVGSNNLTATTLNLGNNNTAAQPAGVPSILNLGNGTNILNVDVINMGLLKQIGIMQFLNHAGGGLTIAGTNGTGRVSTINLGTETSTTGSTTANNNGFMLFSDGVVNILAGTMNLGNRTSRAGNSANGVLSFTRGTVDVTTINMAANTSGSNAVGTISVGGGTLKIGTGGLSLANSGNTAGCIGTLIATNGSTIICSNNIYKTTANGTGVVAISTSSLIMASTGGTIGVSNGIPIDEFDITNSTLTLPVAQSANIAVINFNPDATTHNTINVSSLPSTSTYPSQFPIISYQIVGGNPGTFVLGTLPNGFSGFISNNTTALSIDIVVTSGPVAKADEWGGGINNQWDTTTLNWTNGGVAVSFNDLDFVTFDDLAKTGTVNLTGTRQPATLEINNNTLNYTFTGIGKITGPFALNKDGTGTVTLSESGGDNFAGGITINGGTVILDDANSAISGGLTINGGTTAQIGNHDASGTLPSGTLDNEGMLIFNRTDNIVVSTAIPGGGALTQNGTGKLTLSAANTYTGATLVKNGILALSGTGSLSSSAAIQVTAATLDVSGVTTASTALGEVDMTNATLNVKVGYLQTNLNISVLNMGGAGNTINVSSLPPIASYPATLTLLQSSGGINGYNFVLGSLPSASPAYAGTIAPSADNTAVLLTLTSGPIGTRPSVVWNGNDAIAIGNTNWSDAQNWLTPGVPSAAEKVTFNDIATVGGSPFDLPGDGNGGILFPLNVDNAVDVNLTNAALSYSNTGFHNTLIADGKILVVNGPVSVSGSGGTVTILGTNGTLAVNNPGNNSTLTVAAGTAPTLDMSGLDTFTANASQIGVGYNPANAGANVKGNWYLARTNKITTGVGSFGNSSALVIGGSTGTSGGTGQLYLGQTNALYVDGIAMGISTSTADIIEFNPAISNNPVAYIRGITGDSSRVTSWSLGDNTVNLNNGVPGAGFLVDFSTGTLNALVNTLIVGQGAQGLTANQNITGIFNMGTGNLDVTTLKIGVAGTSSNAGVPTPGGIGIGVMNVTGGTVVVNTVGLGLTGGVAGGATNTSGTLNLTNATLVVSNGISIGSGTAGGNLAAISSTVKILNGTVGSPAAPLTTLNLDGATLQLSINGNVNVTNIVATNIIAGAVSTINIAAISSVNGTVQVPLISYLGADPYASLTLGTHPAGYTVSLIDNTGNSSIDLNITSTGGKPTPRITGIGISGTTLNLNATNGTINGNFVLLGATNIAQPLNQWTPILTNTFDGAGNLNLSTNIVNLAVPRQFYILSQ